VNVWEARALAHHHFDQLWQGGEAGVAGMSRRAAYRWLAGIMQLTDDEAHIRLFDVAQCERVVEESKRYVAGVLERQLAAKRAYEKDVGRHIARRRSQGKRRRSAA